MDRRRILKLGLAGAGLALLPAAAGGCRGLKRSDLEKAAGLPETKAGLDGRRMEILELASLAPSGHNAQPWAIRIVSPDEWLILADPGRRLPEVDPDNRELLLSLGAFTENLVLAAGALGLSARVEVLARTGQEETVARVRLAEGRPSGYPLSRLKGRRTVRNGLKPDELRPADLARLEACLPGNLFYFPRSSAHARCLQEGTVEAFRRQTERDPAQAELARWLRLDNASAVARRDGLTVESMELTGLKALYVRLFLGPADALKPGFRKAGLEAAARQAGEGGGWLVVTGEGSTPEDLLATGRGFERMALLTRELGLALHPMTQMLEEDWGRQEIKTHHPRELNPQFILRVGYLESYPPPVSLRRPVGWFVTQPG